MRRYLIIIVILFIFTPYQLKASDPGPTWGCWVPGSGFYTRWKETRSASPSDPGWIATFQIYWNGPANYNFTEDYNHGDTPPCGYVNPGKQLGNQTTVCFVQSGNAYAQGQLKSYNPTALKQCNVPLDIHVKFILPLFAVLGAYFLRKRLKFSEEH